MRACRRFAELAFARAGIPISWQGPAGVTEVGVISTGERAGQVVVRISQKYFRPSEVGSLTASPQKPHVPLQREVRTRITAPDYKT